MTHAVRDLRNGGTLGTIFALRDGHVRDRTERALFHSEGQHLDLAESEPRD